MNTTKYRLTDEVLSCAGTVLRRIQALRDFGTVKVDHLGGWIADEHNLSHEGNAWVYGDAQVYDNARVSGNAQVYGGAWVYGRAQVYDNARVSRTPKLLTGFPHVVTVTDHHIAAGCQVHPPRVWRARGKAIIRADGRSVTEAEAWAAIIVALADAHGCTDPAVTGHGVGDT